MLVAGVFLAPVGWMFDCAGNESKLPVNFNGGPGRPRRNWVRITLAHARRHGGLVITDHAERHVIIARPHSSDFEQPTDAVEQTPLPTPRVTRVRVSIIAAVEGPESGPGRYHGSASVPD